jgi:hypothetical protein
MKRLLFIGHSHLLSILDAALRMSGTASDRDGLVSFWHMGMGTYDIELAGPEPVRMRFVVVGAATPPLVRIDPEALARLDAHALISVRRRYREAIDDAVTFLDGPIDTVVSCFLGNEHAALSFIEQPVPLDVLVDRDDVGVATDGNPRQIVPVDVVRRELATRIYPTLLYCEILRSRFPDHDVVQVMPPPPIPDDGQIRARPEVFMRLITQYGIAPAALRRKFYVLYAGVLRAELSSRNVRLLEAPDAAVADGFLKPEYWMEATHANEDYGRLVLEQLGAA